MKPVIPGNKEAWVKFLNTASEEDLTKILGKEATDSVIRNRKTKQWKKECDELIGRKQRQ